MCARASVSPAAARNYYGVVLDLETLAIDAPRPAPRNPPGSPCICQRMARSGRSLRRMTAAELSDNAAPSTPPVPGLHIESCCGHGVVSVL